MLKSFNVELNLKELKKYFRVMTDKQTNKILNCYTLLLLYLNKKKSS